MVPPVYPPDALRARLRGLVVLRVLVSESGQPLEIQVVQSAPDGMTEAAVEAVRQWRFEPAVSRGVAVRTWAPVRIPFEAIPFASLTPTPTPTPPSSSDGAALVNPPSAPAREVALPEAAPTPPEPIEARPSARAATPVFRTRRAVRLHLLPAQARIMLDGRFIGIAEDWDSEAGGLELALEPGRAHRIHAELPGYRPFDAEVDVFARAEEESVRAAGELERVAHLAYTRLPRPAAATSREVVVLPEPPEAHVAVDGVPVPVGSAVAPNALELLGPAVHEIAVSAPGFATRLLRVLVAPNAPSSRAVIRAQLISR
jgi:TonB family protein